MRRLTTALLAAAPLAVMLAGCSSNSGTAAGPPPATSAPAAASPTPAPASTESAGDAPTSPAATSSASAGGSRCHSSGLRITLGDAGGGAAGTEYEALVFTNTSRRTCTLYGYPGVSYVAGDQGTQINDPFQRTTATKKTITLKPGAKAHATIGLPNYQNFPAGLCKPTAIRGFRVYPPDETAAVFVAQAMTVCSAKGQGVGLVQPVAAGTAS